MAKPNVDPLALDHQIAAGQTELIGGGDASAFMSEVNEKKGEFDTSQMTVSTAGEGSDPNMAGDSVKAAFDAQNSDLAAKSVEMTDPASAENDAKDAVQRQKELGDLASNGYGAEVVPVEVTQGPSAAEVVPVTVEKPQA